MAPSTLRKALGAVKDTTSIGLAKVGSGSATATELDVAIVKATKHSESMPADERHIREILSLTCYSRAYVGACVASLSRRLGRTRSWAVALKTLMLVHRLLVEGDPAYEQEVFYATRRGTRMLNMSDFRDRSRADAWDFSAFVRTYAAYLDDRLEYRMQGRQGGASRRATSYRDVYQSPCSSQHGYTYGHVNTRFDEEEGEAEAEPGALVPKDTPVSDMTVEQLIAKVQHLQILLDRFLACRPTGAAKMNRVVTVAMCPLVKESVQIYCDLTEIMAIFIEQFAEYETADCARVHSIFCSLAKQVEELDSFYSWCKSAALCRASDVPEVERITQKKLDLMDEFICERRAAASQRRRASPPPAPASPEEPPVEEYDMNAVKALPPPEEPLVAVKEENAGEAEHAEPEGSLIAAKVDDHEADFLNLKGHVVSGEDHGQKVALALFDGTPAGSAPKWPALDPSSNDWETALVQSASTLTVQRAELGGGFNMMTLDGMYSHATANATGTNMQTFTGSASSVAMRPPGVPMLALPAPPMSHGAAIGADPFTASMAVPPPTYVQMADMHTKQRFLMEEQMAWQQYSRKGMQGQVGYAKLEQQVQQQPLMPTGGYQYFGGYYRAY